MADTTYTAVDLSRLPAPDIIEQLDFETILADAVARMKVEMPTFVSRDSDPATKLLQVFAYLSQLLRQRINDAARAVMPAYAVGGDLDNLAALFGVVRRAMAAADPLTGTAAVMESDDEFRRRMVLAPEGYSVAGPEGAYIFHALSAHSDVLDASAGSPAPGEVLVAILSRTGSGEAAADVVAAVQSYLSADTRRPLTDHVTVQSAQIVPFNVIAELTTFTGPDAGLVLETAQGRLEAYIAASRRLGRDITRSAIFAALHAEGVQNVRLVAPAADIILSRQQAPHCTGITLSLAGNGE
ncbi:baseplate assembly protein [Sphingobium yanoikuyae]|uniref:baseplate assembly protein n=1 Tax=Sphingobium yanoikuyae TaxID=13690 RepID=UPI002FD91026